MYAVTGTRRGTAPAAGGHHSFNAGVFLVRNTGLARRLFQYWLGLRPRTLEVHLYGPGWGLAGYEQYEFDTKVCSRREFRDAIKLVDQHRFCPQSAAVSSTVTRAAPFVHFYGKARQYTGKTLIQKWVRAVWDQMSRANRQLYPAVGVYVSTAESRAQDATAVMKRADKARRTTAIRRSVGKRVRYRGKPFQSIGVAAAHFGVERRVVRAACRLL